MDNSKDFDVIVIGGGASGLIASIAAANNNKRVLIIEQKDKLGKKILATGNGKCNFTNLDMDFSHFRGDLKLVESVIPQFDLKTTISFFENLGILPKSKNGYLYPNSEQAQSILTALLLEIEHQDITVKTSETLISIKHTDNFYIKTDKDRYTAKSLIIATGLLASPKLGSDGSSFDAIKNLGHSFTQIVPALCGFEAKGFPFKKAAGVRCEAMLKLYIDNKFVVSEPGELQLADYGVSGIPVFQISRFASLGILNNKKCELTIDLLPGLSKDEAFELISNKYNNSHKNIMVVDLFNGIINQKLAISLINNSSIDPSTKLAKITEDKLTTLINNVKELKVTLVKPRGYEFAQVCAGGINTNEIDINSLESKLVSGLFFAGEILDVDGICGGYNLQWAWSSGYIAGCNASR